MQAWGARGGDGWARALQVPGSNAAVPHSRHSPDAAGMESEQRSARSARAARRALLSRGLRHGAAAASPER